jgi:hypothetical protein
MPQGAKYGGRKKGTPNKATAAVRERIEAEADPIGFMTRIVNGEEIDGERPTLDQRAHAARWLGAKVAPDAKASPVRFDVGALETPADALKAMGALITATGHGEVLGSDAKLVSDLITGFLKAYEAHELESRVAALEGQRP